METLQQYVDYRAERVDVEQMYGAHLSELLTIDHWKEKVQAVLTNDSSLHYNQIVKLVKQTS